MHEKGNGNFSTTSRGEVARFQAGYRMWAGEGVPIPNINRQIKSVQFNKTPCLMVQGLDPKELDDLSRTRHSRCRMIWLLTPILLSASCLSFSVFLRVDSRAYRRGWGRSQIIRRRECSINHFILPGLDHIVV
jgi:hypothetical protein